MNQAIGRVIRHRQDYGSILLLDSRYLYSSNKSQISGWLRNNIREPKDYDAYDLQLRAFFQKMEKMNFQPKVKQLEQLKIEFDDYEASGVGLQLPKTINSKKKFDVGPSNN